MATETNDQKIIARTKHGPGVFSLAIALFQPGPQHYIEFECQPILFGEYEIIAIRAHIFSAKNVSPHPKTNKKFWKFTGVVDKVLNTKNRAWYGLNELRFWEGPNRIKLFPPIFSWVYQLDGGKGQIVLSHDETDE